MPPQTPTPLLPPKALIGMIHVQALPGTPNARLAVRELIATAVDEARTLRAAGFDAISLENMHDVPYLRRDVGPEITAALTAVAVAVRREVDCPLGIQILAGANRAALAVALAADLQFIRAEGFVFGHVADEGWIDADAGPLLRYRRFIGAEHIHIFTDVKKKHSAHAATADVTLAETAEAACFFGANGVIITGTATGKTVSIEDLQAVRAHITVPVIVGSGTTPENLSTLWPHADAFIVGSSLKQNGLWSNPLDPARCDALVNAAQSLRAKRAS